MEGLVEVVPGHGWLGRRGSRIVWMAEGLPKEDALALIGVVLGTESDDDAHDALAETGDGLTRLLLSQSDGVRATAFGFEPSLVNSGLRFEPAPEAAHRWHGPVPTVTTANPTNIEPSGMFVQGVVRAGGFRWYPAQDRTVQRADGGWQLCGRSDSIGLAECLVLGRRAAAQVAKGDVTVSLNDPGVSRVHASIRLDQGHPVLYDLESTNGTYIVLPDESRPLRIHQSVPYRLQDGDLLIIGASWFFVSGP